MIARCRCGEACYSFGPVFSLGRSWCIRISKYITVSVPKGGTFFAHLAVAGSLGRRRVYRTRSRSVATYFEILAPFPRR